MLSLVVFGESGEDDILIDFWSTVIATAITSAGSVLVILLPLLIKSRREQKKINAIVQYELTPNGGASSKDGINRLPLMEKQLNTILHKLSDIESLREDVRTHVAEGNDTLITLDKNLEHQFEEMKDLKVALDIPVRTPPPQKLVQFSMPRASKTRKTPPFNASQ